MSEWNFAEIYLDNHIVVFFNDSNKGLYEQDTEIITFSWIDVKKTDSEFIIKLNRPDSDFTYEYRVKEINYLFEPVWYKLLDQLAPKK
jgi:hypothetical protein